MPILFRLTRMRGINSRAAGEINSKTSDLEQHLYENQQTIYNIKINETAVHMTSQFADPLHNVISSAVLSCIDNLIALSSKKPCNSFVCLECSKIYILPTKEGCNFCPSVSHFCLCDFFSLCVHKGFNFSILQFNRDVSRKGRNIGIILLLKNRLCNP